MCLIYKSASWTREPPVCFCLGGGGRGPSTKTPLCVSSAGSPGGERALGRVGVEGKTKEQKHKTRTQNKLNINKVVVELTQSFVALDFPVGEGVL